MPTLQKANRRFLRAISKRRAEQVLTAWANNPHDAEKFPEIDVPTEAKRFGVEDPAEKETELYIIRRIAKFIRKAWSAKDERRFDWYLRKALNAYEDGALTIVDEEPPDEVSPIEAALLYMGRERKRVLVCKNPACARPYFFLAKKGQRFCSVGCSLASYRASKRKWAKNDRMKKAKARKKL